jgi:SsrA-binding protein
MCGMSILIENKKAGFNYHITEKMEAGLVLTGQEVKSLRERKGSLFGSYLSIKDNECYLLGCNIPPYQPKNTPSSYNSKKERKLLLKRKEIDYLLGRTKEKGITLIPLKIYTKKNLLKLEFGIAKGKKKYDKRGAIKKREIERSIRRVIRR